jgi:lipoprotein NlpD
MQRYFRSGPGLSLALLLLGGCASDGPAPVEDLSEGAGSRVVSPAPERKPATPAGDRYRVERGDTLYSIAFRHGVDYRDLATWNGISAPYTIYVGQELRTSSAPRTSVAHAPPPTPRAPTPSSTVAASASTAPRSSASDVAKPTPFEPVAQTPPAATAPVAPAPPKSTTASPPIAATPTTPVAATPPPAAVVETPAKAPPATAPSEPVATNGEVAWRWPADGQVVGTYAAGDQTRQGIDIAGKAGDSVRAAADGSVVYSGNGLIGYGELIIIKHSPSFLSAYGHNRKRLVKEGDRVKAGQVIAEMGSSSASRDSLHFEIRRNGKPANPVDYLPRR